MSCAFCGHTDPADLTTRQTQQHGTIALCVDDRACLERMKPLLAAEIARRNAARRPRK